MNQCFGRKKGASWPSGHKGLNTGFGGVLPCKLTRVSKKGTRGILLALEQNFILLRFLIILTLVDTVECPDLSYDKSVQI